MQMQGRHVAGLCALAVAGLFFLDFDASAQEVKKPATKAVSACKGLDEKACKGKAAECLWIVPSKGKQRPYCRIKTGGKKKA
jgi:hypothetical protein